MKKVVSLVFLYLFMIAANATTNDENAGKKNEGIKFEKISFEEALKQAAKENKLIFVDCYTVWCDPCKRMDINIFPKKEVGGFYNKHFINLKIDMEKGEGINLKNEYGVNAFPTFLYINNNREVIHKSTGACDIEGFIKNAKVALDPSTNLYSFNKKYKSGVRDIQFLKEYLELLKCAYDMSYQSVFDEYFKLVSKEEMLTQNGLDNIIKYAGIQSQAMDFLFDHLDVYQELSEKPMYSLLFEKLMRLMGKLYKNDMESYNEKSSYFKKKMGKDWDYIHELIEWRNMVFVKKDKATGYKMAFAYYIKFKDRSKADDFWSTALSVGIAEESLPESLYKEALEMLEVAKEKGMKEDDKNFVFSKALLYSKTGRKEEAIEMLKDNIKNLSDSPKDKRRLEIYTRELKKIENEEKKSFN